MSTRVKNAFLGEFIPRMIEGFPYPERKCRFCSEYLRLDDAVHIYGAEEVYKALYFCEADKCPAYDEPAGKQYARVYYSCEEALKKLEPVRIWKHVKKK